MSMDRIVNAGRSPPPELQPVARALAGRWRIPFRGTWRPDLVRADGRLLFADGAGTLRVVSELAPGAGFVGWPAVPLPRGAFRPSAGLPLFVAERGDLLRVRGDLGLESLGATGAADDTQVEAIGLVDGGAVVAVEGSVRRLQADGSVAWHVHGPWTPVLADASVVVGTEGSELLVVIDARTGTLLRRGDLDGSRPFACAAGRIWLRGRAAELAGISLDGGPTMRVPLAAPYPRPLLAGQDRAVVVAGELVVQQVDLRSGTVTNTATFAAPEAWPLLVTDDGSVLYRDRGGGLLLLDLDRPGEPTTLLLGSLFVAAQVQAGFLFVLETAWDDREAATLHCLGPLSPTLRDELGPASPGSGGVILRF